MVVKHGKRIGSRTSNECNSWLFRVLAAISPRHKVIIRTARALHQLSRRNNPHFTYRPSHWGSE